MSYYLPVLQKGWFFYSCDYWTFHIWNPRFQVPECSNHSKLNQFCHFSHFTVISDIWDDKMSNFCCIHPFHSIHHLKIQRWHLLSLITIKCLEMSPKCHLNVIYRLVLLNNFRYLFITWVFFKLFHLFHKITINQPSVSLFIIKSLNITKLTKLT